MDAPIQYEDSDEEEEGQVLVYNRMLEQDLLSMLNPGSLEMMTKAYHIDLNSAASMLPQERYRTCYYLFLG